MRGLLAAFLLLPALAWADFDQAPCFPLGGEACARVPNNFAVDGGQLMCRADSPTIVFHDIQATDGDDNASIVVACTDAGSGTEDCDVTLSQQEAGASKVILFADADGGITVGSGNNNSFTVTTDGTGDGEVVLPAGSIGSAEISTDLTGSNITDGSIATADLAVGAVTNTRLGATALDSIILCGDSFNTTTGYIGPSAAAYLGSGADTTINSTVCQALDSTTEATADAPISAAFPAFKVHGFWCVLSSDPASDVVITARSAAAGLTPAVTCTIAGTGSATSCRALTSTTTDVAAGATIALQVVTLEDLSAQDIWCKLFFSLS